MGARSELDRICNSILGNRFGSAMENAIAENERENDAFRFAKTERWHGYSHICHTATNLDYVPTGNVYNMCGHDVYESVPYATDYTISFAY